MITAKEARNLVLCVNSAAHDAVDDACEKIGQAAIKGKREISIETDFWKKWSDNWQIASDALRDMGFHVEYRELVSWSYVHITW